jgi:hypothetical protein
MPNTPHMGSQLKTLMLPSAPRNPSLQLRRHKQ